jgi:hypothetical protein
MTDERYPDAGSHAGSNSVQCPKCQAPTGRSCINMRTGGPLKLGANHPDRERLYVEQYREGQLAAWRRSQQRDVQS